MTQTFDFQFPTSAMSDVGSFIQSNWYQASVTNYGKSDMSFVSDPFNSTGSSSQVLRVLYNQGSYAVTSGSGIMGGAEFYSQPGGGNYDSALLRYDLAFDPTFQFVQGGKLPGLFGGDPTQGCSGGHQATGSNCYSMRLMWRANGAGEAYGYLPNQGGLCQEANVLCNDQYGTSFSRGMIQFKTATWTTLEIYVKINDASSSNGLLQVWQDGNIVINRNDMRYRTTNAIAATSLFFSTFYGGSDPSYAAATNTYTYFKNIQYSTGQPVTLSNSLASTLSPSLAFWWTALASLFMAHLFL
ncbi:hypothetical protein DM01DRAFT_1335027 [Hesseltinella vesiculosa]|uniref:Polysaccharide lyase 14 domain-containing protein n=1 Tax=Hesseltinella vesiculosa TaxID=101127 RepID=A0A1X2GK50_9FUNG|nr:hypothetical protein DM01DRAFT_1335027 [Hesseltinella vesiculosa]